MKTFLLLLFTLILSHFCHAQSFAINTDGSAANSSAILDVKSTTKGLLIPRLTKAQKYAITTPATGLLIYQTAPDSIGFYYYQNSQWTWITDNKKSDSSYWGLHGNINMNPPTSNNNGAIDFVNDTYLGTTEFKDVSMIAGGNELVRLKQVPVGGLIGLSNRSPEYGLDMRLSDQNPQSDIVGMRIISNPLFNFNGSNLNKGLVIGNSISNPNETVIWNHGNNINASLHIGLDSYNEQIRPAININQYGLGIYQRHPRYALDIHSRSQFYTATPSTNKNGMRITYNGQEDQNEDYKGLFMGVDIINSFKSYLWNYADGQDGNSPDRAIYFGVGSDMDLSSHRATMELQDGKIIMGHIPDPYFFFPSTLNIQTDYASGVAKNGISIMKHLVNGQESGYFGTDFNDNLNLYKYGGGNILIGNPVDYTLTINSNNQVGIKTLYPNADLQFSDSYANNKLVLNNNFFGNISNNDHDFYGFGVNVGSMRYQVPRTGTAHIFYAGNITGTASNELMRITGEGFVGINNNNPKAPLEFSGTALNRKIVISNFLNNDHNFMGFGNSPDGGLRYQVPESNFDHVFYKGDSGGFSSTELFRILGNGNVGIGANFPSGYGHGGTNKIVEIKNPAGGSNIQSHLILSSAGSSGALGGITWASTSLPQPGEQRTGFIGNSFETANQTKLSFYTRSAAAVLNESFYIQGNGNAWLQGTLTQASDARLKKNIRQLKDPIEKLNRLNGYTYNWIDQQRDNNTQMGVLAQEVQKVYPELVKTDPNGNLSVNYSGLIPVLIEAVKAQQKQIDEQRKLIEQLLKK